ncbi:hypothetical protein [Neolewinella litorea]|uniref:Periplasmic heavy metal sensor n=1 Tax=Neolewinella litorea TaxID=2562452 RepID=A0A4S4NLW2_9BACT|nr:hypothetical protein [Neolewinella litorea]THH39341.1 hypothetical protein E4021_11335 [Neolewinella litorea]
MKTTRMILFAFLFFLTAGGLFAQDDAGLDPVARAERQAERLTTVLDLSPEQADQVKEINTAFARDAEAAREEMRQTMEKARSERKARIKEVLTAEQFKKLEALEAGRRERHQDGKAGHQRPRQRDRG